MADSIRYKDWLSKSSQDIKAARVLKDNNCGNDIVTFHCQQAIEKAFKGFLLFHTSELEEGHSLIFLCKSASSFNIAFKNYLKDCAFVNQYYIETRYPADNPLVVTDDEADECIKIAKNIYEYIESKLCMNDKGEGDYTKERKELHKDINLDEIKRSLE